MPCEVVCNYIIRSCNYVTPGWLHNTFMWLTNYITHTCDYVIPDKLHNTLTWLINYLCRKYQVTQRLSKTQLLYMHVHQYTVYTHAQKTVSLCMHRWNWREPKRCWSQQWWWTWNQEWLSLRTLEGELNHIPHSPYQYIAAGVSPAIVWEPVCTGCAGKLSVRERNSAQKR